MQAEEDVDQLKSWDAIYHSFKRFSHCDDGGIGEGYSDAVGKLLANDWNHFQDLLKLTTQDKGFQTFVVRHVDETIPDDTLSRVRKNAKSQCPADGVQLCKMIIKAAASP